MKKNLLFTIIALFISMAAMADGGSCGANLTWDYNSSTHTLTISGSGEMYDFSVTNQPWHSHQLDIQHVVVNNGATSIGNYAFYAFLYMQSASLPNSLTRIGKDAFSDTAITSIQIPNSVNEIGESAFQNCESLVSANIPNSLTTINNYVFSGCTSLQSAITIPNSVTHIGALAFSNTQITALTIGTGLETAGTNPFLDCNNITTF